MAEKTTLTPEQRLEKIEQLTEEYEKVSGISFVCNNEGEKYLSVNKEYLSKMSPQELGEASILLAQLATYVNKCYNKEIARVNWCEETIKTTITPNIHQYSGISFEERKLKAIEDNEYAKRLDVLRKQAKFRSDRLQFLSTNIKSVSEAFDNLRRTKGYNNAS